jgi:hypothetical protein
MANAMASFITASIFGDSEKHPFVHHCYGAQLETSALWYELYLGYLGCILTIQHSWRVDASARRVVVTASAASTSQLDGMGHWVVYLDLVAMANISAHGSGLFCVGHRGLPARPLRSKTAASACMLRVAKIGLTPPVH